MVPGSVPRAEERMSAPEPRIYAYGIVRLHDGDDLAAPVPVRGLHGGAVRALACGRLAALVSDLPPQASAPFDDVWRDPDRIKSLVLEHHRVLHGVVLERAVLPLRFGAVFSGDDGVATTLAMHCDALWEALDRVDGAREWGVKIFCDQDVLHSHLSQDTDGVGAGPAQINAPSAGRAFFMRRQMEHRAAQDVRDSIIRRIVESGRLLSAAARTAAALRIQPPAIHGRADEMVCNSAFLVAQEQENRFLAVIDGLRDVSPRSGFDYELNGPWAPCSFAHFSLGSA